MQIRESSHRKGGPEAKYWRIREVRVEINGLEDMPEVVTGTNPGAGVANRSDS